MKHKIVYGLIFLTITHSMQPMLIKDRPAANHVNQRFTAAMTPGEFADDPEFVHEYQTKRALLQQAEEAEQRNREEAQPLNQEITKAQLNIIRQEVAELHNQINNLPDGAKKRYFQELLRQKGINAQLDLQVARTVEQIQATTKQLTQAKTETEKTKLLNYKIQLHEKLRSLYSKQIAARENLAAFYGIRGVATSSELLTMQTGLSLQDRESTVRKANQPLSRHVAKLDELIQKKEFKQLQKEVDSLTPGLEKNKKELLLNTKKEVVSLKTKKNLLISELQKMNNDLPEPRQLHQTEQVQAKAQKHAEFVNHLKELLEKLNYLLKTMKVKTSKSKL